MPKLLDGKFVRDQILAELRPRIERVRSASGRPPGLAVVLVGNDPASQIYVRNKVKTCEELGIFSENITPPATSSNSPTTTKIGTEIAAKASALIFTRDERMQAASARRSLLV